MSHFVVTTLLVLSIAYLEICRCSQNGTELTAEKRNSEIIEQLGRKLRNFWSWIKQQAKSEDTFVGRCAGAFKKLGLVMNFVIFKLGVIVTALAFLSVLVLKSLALGVLLLVISAVGLFAKLFALKQGGGQESHSSHGSAVHLHIHNKGGHDSPYHSHSDLYDRVGHPIARTPAEQLAIADLYRRVGVATNLYGSSSAQDIYR